jgi:hypothetical protein
MMAVRRARLADALGWLFVVAGLTGAVLAGAGLNAATKDTATAAEAAVCAEPTHEQAWPSPVSPIDRVSITRIVTEPNHERFTFPADITITGFQRARSVARALCELPVMPPGVYNCPADLGISYRLGLVTTDHTLISVDLDATGCEQVYGLGHRWTATSPGFWSLLANAAGLGRAGSSAFIGIWPR